MMERRRILIWIVTGFLQMMICSLSWASDLYVQGINSYSEGCRIDLQYQADKPLETKWLINSKNQTLSQIEECGINIKSYPNKIIIRSYNPNENAWQELNLVLNDKKEIIYFSETIGANKGNVQASCESFIRIRKFIQYCDVKLVSEIEYDSAIENASKNKIPTVVDILEKNQSAKKNLSTKNSTLPKDKKTKKNRQASKLENL